MSDAACLHLASDWTPTGRGTGNLELTLSNGSGLTLHRFRLAFTSLFPLVVQDQQLRGGRLSERFSNYQVISPPEGFVLAPGASWSFSAQLGCALQHYTSAVKSAYLILEDEGTLPVVASPTTRNGERGVPLTTAAPVSNLACELPLGLVPFPFGARIRGAREKASALRLADAPASAEQAFHAAAVLAERLFPSDPALFTRSGDIGCAARPAADIGEEGYRINFAADAVTLHASRPAGFLYGFISLGQILRATRLDPSRFVFPSSGEIVDAPRFAWRGMLVDVARQVFHPAELTSIIDYAAWHKLNRLHLHLSDDEGWRLHVPGYPQLAEIAGRRGHGLPIPPLLGSSAEPYGIVYSPDDIAALTRRAAELNIALVPEIDMPGHSYGVLQAIPELRDCADTGSQRGILNPAVPKTYEYVRAVIGEVSRLFPSPWIHVGGDEVPADAWSGSPLARDFMRARGLQQPYQLQSYFLRRVQEIVRDHGRCTGAWEEAALGGGMAPSHCYLLAWRKSASGLALARQGYDVVLSPGEAYYLDMAQSDDWWDPGMDWAGTVSAERCYSYQPGGDWRPELVPRLLGVQACLWSENLHDRGILARLTTPRLAAVAESAWSPSGSKSFGRFAAIAGLLPSLSVGSRR
jgi:hexosaminidase